MSMPLEDMEKAKKEAASGVDEQPQKIPEMGYFLLAQQINSLSQQISSFRTELKQDINSLRSETKQDISEIKQDINSLRNQVKQDISEIKQELNSLRNEVKQEIYGLRSEMKTDINTIQAEIGSLRLWSIGTVAAIFVAAVGWLITWIAAKP